MRHACIAATALLLATSQGPAHARNFQAGTGRYLQADPTGLEGGLSRYNYVDANPLTHIDPYGLEKIILLNRADINYPAAATAPDIPGQLTIYAHGNPDRVGNMNAAALAKYLRDGEVWKPGMPIKLDSCRTGEGDANIASELSRNLGTMVTAPNARTLTIGQTDMGAWHSLNIPGTERAIAYWPGKWITYPTPPTRK